MRVILPGAVAFRPIKITVNKLDQEMVDWWVMQGAEAQEIHDPYYNNRGTSTVDTHYRIRVPNVIGSKWSHKFNDGSGIYLIHLPETYASTASLFCLKFFDAIINHNIEVDEDATETQ
jgi:hypothetical protein